MTYTVYLALGANLGDRRQNLVEAIKRLDECITVERSSSIYETEPWGVTDQPSFLNQVVEARTTRSPQQLWRCTYDIQLTMGRKADGIRYGPRLIDIDILFYNDLSFASYNLTVPHARLIERSFVLVPLAEIAPDMVYPGLGCTVQDLLERIELDGIEKV
ncbi:MAG: 2-amino-4-hydroxy-6-hydroxymethyldihydropteridine diphosphokinase [Chloroflexi bacterium]|nr:2-amino-4-hydroxy-6-hydroxymethyldihydropteridine diphosphokinase [Chloroflexota bacterium]